MPHARGRDGSHQLIEGRPEWPAMRARRWYGEGGRLCGWRAAGLLEATHLLILLMRRAGSISGRLAVTGRDNGDLELGRRVTPLRSERSNCDLIVYLFGPGFSGSGRFCRAARIASFIKKRFNVVSKLCALVGRLTTIGCSPVTSCSSGTIV